MIRNGCAAIQLGINLLLRCSRGVIPCRPSLMEVSRHELGQLGGDSVADHAGYGAG